jgi:hypothetical protein
MNDSRFDVFARALVQTRSRRQLLAALSLVLVGGGSMINVAVVDAKKGGSGKGSNGGPGKKEEEDKPNAKDRTDEKYKDKSPKHAKGKAEKKGQDRPRQMIQTCRGEGHPCEGNQICCDGLVCSPDGAGQAMRCVVEGAASAEPASPSPETIQGGELLVHVKGCALASARDDYDWEAKCLEPVDHATFELRIVDSPKDSTPLTEATTTNGEVRFTELEPDLYALKRVGGVWCHAESDGVDADGNLIVTSGQTTTVWTYVCLQA